MRGYSLIELLVVLVIIGVLAGVGVYSLGSRGPNAVRSATVSLRGAIREAQELAVSSGQEITLTATLDNAGRSAVIQGKDPQGNLLMDYKLDSGLFRNVEILVSSGKVPSSAKSVTGIANFGFDSSGAGWNKPLFSDAGGSPSTGITFTPARGIVLVSTSGGSTTRTDLSSGFWVGVLGTTANVSGPAAGLVLVSASVKVSSAGTSATVMGSQVAAFYTSDSSLTSDSNHKWQRLD